MDCLSRKDVSDCFGIYNKYTGNRLVMSNGYFFPYFDTYAEARYFMRDRDCAKAVICRVECFVLFDEKGNFVKRETIVTPLE